MNSNNENFIQKLDIRKKLLSFLDVLLIIIIIFINIIFGNKSN